MVIGWNNWNSEVSYWVGLVLQFPRSGGGFTLTLVLLMHEVMVRSENAYQSWNVKCQLMVVICTAKDSEFRKAAQQRTEVQFSLDSITEE